MAVKRKSGHDLIPDDRNNELSTILARGYRRLNGEWDKCPETDIKPDDDSDISANGLDEEKPL